jgi:hypothetical protein
MDSLLWLEEEKSDCKGKWIDENLFPVGEKTKGRSVILGFIFFKQGSLMLSDFFKLVKPVHAVTCI